MQPRDNSPSAGEAGPLDDETHARVLDHQSSGMIHAITEHGLHLVKLRVPADGRSHSPGARFNFRDSEDEDETASLLGTLRHRDLSNMAQNELISVVKSILIDNPEKCLSFYNKAGNLTLKKHAFTLLPGIGDSKAMSMVEIRGRVGWEQISDLDEVCQIDSAGLLAERLCLEIMDHHMSPSLLNLLIRA